MIPVWDAALRLLHGLLVFSVAAAWLTRHSRGEWHEWLGYAALAVVAARVAYGFFGNGYTRFSDFVRPATETAAYARDVLGGWMVVALLAMVALVGFTGWLYTTDRYWGVEWVEELHEALSNILFAFVALHLAGVVFTSVKHRENLVAAMLHGRKRG
jgi:cytochrome b